MVSEFTSTQQGRGDSLQQWMCISLKAPEEVKSWLLMDSDIKGTNRQAHCSTGDAGGKRAVLK